MPYLLNRDYKGTLAAGRHRQKIVLGVGQGTGPSNTARMHATGRTSSLATTLHAPGAIAANITS
ncbi:hypothetical protein IscW_ISCW011605 [Ixodes scapularis]|uniref:Uncharacterized protein n=1 Tax=Ixodes scapularis TaxID=6945 RepID=B7Q9S9_IXOSC|nr:hypothetical protein IscW_ISCW011605 [Ixodes scapularis]|eukprot:XP_002412539.1 hypothetical protein IscW_ISCW011605 [Ixodes scapularis]